MLMHAIADGSCMDAVRECTNNSNKLKKKERKKDAPGTRTRVSVAPGFSFEVLPAELFFAHSWGNEVKRLKSSSEREAS